MEKTKCLIRDDDDDDDDYVPDQETKCFRLLELFVQNPLRPKSSK